MFYFKGAVWGLSYKTVCRIISKSVGTAKSRVLRTPKTIQIDKTLRRQENFQENFPLLIITEFLQVLAQLDQLYVPL